MRPELRVVILCPFQGASGPATAVPHVQQKHGVEGVAALWGNALGRGASAGSSGAVGRVRLLMARGHLPGTWSHRSTRLAALQSEAPIGPSPVPVPRVFPPSFIGIMTHSTVLV